MRKVVAGIVGFALCSGSVLHAAAWTPPSGSNGTINYTNGQDINGLFGNPGIGEQKFAFANPSSFAVVSPAGPLNITDTASVNVAASPGLFLNTVSVRVKGLYTIVGSPATLTFSGSLNIDGGAIVAPIVFVPSSPITSGSALFIGTALIDLPASTSSVQASLTFTMSAMSSGSATAQMQNLNADLTFTTIPEPTTLGLLAGAGSMLLRRRRA